MVLVNFNIKIQQKDFSISELEEISKLMRAYAITAISYAKSGHTGGVMSIIDIAAVLYFKVAKHDPANPGWEDRDRIFWSSGHKAPALYAALGLAGYFDINDIVKLRRFGSGFEGHPNRFNLPGIEASSGSLGQGLGLSVGSAINAKIEKKDYRVFCILGDGELNEGSVWEAAMSASHYRLDNLTAIIDRNGLQIDGKTSDVMEIEPLKEKWISFGWDAIECDGHDIKDLINAFKPENKKNSRPSVIIANTVKGKSISFAENVCAYHGIAPKGGIEGAESLDQALSDIGCSIFSEDKVKNLNKIVKEYQEVTDKKIESLVPKYSRNYFWNSSDMMKVNMVANRAGFGKGLEKAGADPRVVALGADITDSIKISDFYINNPERKARFFSMGIAEQNMTTVAAGLAKEGKIPFIGSYGVFITGRNWDQLRTTVCYNNYNVKIVDAHGGISVGPDGATHQALEDISNLYYLPNMQIIVPADSIEAEKATLALKEINGPVSIRLAREATPLISDVESVFEYGKANVIRYRKEMPDFKDAFEIITSGDYKSENEDISIIGCGPIIVEAMRASYILKEEFGIETRVINMHTLKPMDKDAIIKAVNETGKIITVEEHQVGGFGNIVAGIVMENKNFAVPAILKMIGIKDRFGESGQPWELMKVFGLTAEFIVKDAISILQIKKT
ncbi:MAG: transketolase [Actinobacteria bacterium]|nr:transketolase [Actinomycetota bacterium]